MLIVTGTVTATAATFAAVREASLAHVRRSREEPGCLQHSVHVDCEEPLRLFFFERWTDRDALHAHFKVDGTRAFLAALAGAEVAATGPEIRDVAEPAT